VFTNGTPCDLTGEPRSTEVRFVCAPDSGLSAGTSSGEALSAHFIESVKEPTTCHYVLTFGTPLICKHNAFRVEEAPVSHIRCRHLTNPGEPLVGKGDSPAGAAAAAVGAALVEREDAAAAMAAGGTRDDTEL
jgi:protein OS-9